MSQESKVPSPASSDPAQPSRQKRTERSVLRYIALLFCAAFLLLLVAYMMDRRQSHLIQSQNEDQISSLLQSVSAVQSLQDLHDENTRLTSSLSALERQLEELEARTKAAEGALQEMQAALEQETRSNQAMDWFWQIDEAYVRGRIALARQLIHSFQALELVDALPAQSVTDTNRYSPAQRYQEIYEALF